MNCFFNKQGEKRRHPFGWRGFSAQFVGKESAKNVNLLLNDALNLHTRFFL